MSKKNKGYRKVKALKGTIFDGKMADRLDDIVTRQRRLGFWYSHGINPAAVASNADDSPAVESIGNGMVRVYYGAIYIPPDQKTWPEWRNGHLSVPPGVECHHGGYRKRHAVTRIKSVDARLEEVL